ncbi:class I SAM-dependent methyltransferase [Chryseobacterium sp. EO14]|uniref:class I SAM-dependent methyltransferase n=1 Tax=Chryseobacterium sp. EO14 TaxID=2950551 RepID=UPI00210ED5A6|nr:class I SAM-dependent methyltransferase [Chryseobacterium sp. EO14]MCQ4142452.1 class I SAM-dependent methyltransferase [Chryseobacterium sp. EO14]
MSSDYYNKVKTYYDKDSVAFEKRYHENSTLKRIRKSFRKETEKYFFNNILEIGFGPGFDIEYFARKFPEKEVYGIDISDGMKNIAMQTMYNEGIKNVSLAVGSVEDVKKRFADTQFDMIIVYFGALNTVENIEEIQEHLLKILSPTGNMTLTFVNKWYLMAIIKPLIKLKFSTAFKRLRKVWGGYSPTQFLPSKCYSSMEIKRYFDKFRIIEKRGYSILYPAWYENRITQKFPNLVERLWKMDKLLQRTPFWNFGEYSLYVFKRK